MRKMNKVVLHSKILNFVLIFSLFSSPVWAQVYIKNELPTIQDLSIGVIPQSGDVVISYPIKVIDSQNKLQPSLSLNYSSTMRNGFLGVGWNLPLDYVEINTKYGAPKYDGSEKYILVINGSSNELVLDSSTQTYRVEIEGGFFKIEKLSDNSWKVTNKQGTIYTFGKTDDSKVYDRATSTKTFRWYVNQVQDVLGNSMKYAYQIIGNQIYPQSISYTENLNKPLSPYATVEFELANRNKNILSYSQGFKVETTKFINRIVVKAGGIVQRQYDLTYSVSPHTQRDLLTSITEKDKDGNALLPTQFSYYGDIKSFSTASASIPTEAQFSASGFDLGVRIADLDGDAYPDMIQSYYVGNAELRTEGKLERIFMNNKNNGWVLDSSKSVPGTCARAFCSPFMVTGRGQRPLNNTWQFVTDNIDAGSRLVDINNDGKVDLIQANDQYANVDGFVKDEFLKGVYLNNGNGWTANQSNWELPGFELLDFWMIFGHTSNPSNFVWIREYLGNVFTDVNNDGFNDFVSTKRITNYSSGTIYKDYTSRTYLNTGSGWSENSNWVPPSTNADFSDGATFVDLNGDFLPDIFYRKTGATKIYMNIGKGWQEDPASPWLNTSNLGDMLDGSTQFADLNGDGLEDMIIAKGSFSSGSRVLINTGYGWFQDDSWVFSGPNFQNIGTRLLDANADTMIDYMINDGSTKALYLNTGNPADLLKDVNNGNGGKTLIEYTSSAQYNQSFLPFPLRLVAKKIISNAQGNSYQTSFEYRNGLWVPAEREFRGFGEMKEVRNDSGYTITNYLQDNFRQGKTSLEKTYDGINTLLFQSTFDWQTAPIISGVQFPFLSRKDEFIYSPTGNKRTAETYTYDQYGNILRLIQMGDVNEISGNDEGDDYRETQMEYVYNLSSNILGLPREINLKDSLGNIISTKWLYYDESLDNQATPSLGLLTQEKLWAGTGDDQDNPKTKYSYNVFGNVRFVTDPNLGVTETIYDNQYGLFPKTVKNAKNHTTQYTYYGVDCTSLNDGNWLKGIWGQLKSVTDPNGQTSYTSYDGFGRKSLEISPKDSVTYPLVYTVHSETPSYKKISTYKRVNHMQPATINTYEFYDGLGRLLQVKTPAPEGGYHVTARAEYNFRDQATKQFVPYTVTSALDVIEVSNNGLAYTSSIYDTLGRLVRKYNPDLTYATREYQGRTLIQKDENGHRQDSITDAFGQLVKKEEYLGADGRFSSKYPALAYSSQPYAWTNYKYDLRGNLKEVKDQDNNITTIVYNKLGRKESMTDPDMGFWQYFYDLNGNLKEQRDAKNHSIFFGYDALNRLTGKWDDSGMNNVYEYDDINKSFSLGRLTSVTFLEGSRAFDYDQLGHQIQTTNTISGSLYPMKFNYNALNDIADIEFPNQRKAFYKFNLLGQPRGAATDANLIPLNPETPPPPPPTSITLESPYIHYKMNDNTETTTVIDAGRGNNPGVASTNTSALTAAGKVGQGFHFDGVTQRIDLANLIASIKNDDVGTISFWFKSDQTQDAALFQLYSAQSLGGFNIQMLNSGRIYIFAANATTTFYYQFSNTTFAPGGWHHMTVTQNKAGVKFYADGVLLSVTDYSSNDLNAWFNQVNPSSLNVMRLANYYRDNTGERFFFKGTLDDFRYYKRGLTADEVKAIYNNGNGQEESVITYTP